MPLLPFQRDGDWDEETQVSAPTKLVMNQTLCVACLLKDPREMLVGDYVLEARKGWRKGSLP